MALFDFFKKSKKQSSPPKQSEKRADRERVKSKKQIGAGKPTKPGKAVSPKRKRREAATAGAKLKTSRFAWRVLDGPHVTEKSTDVTSQNKYTFKILNSATKPEVARAIEDVYGVAVVSVNKISVPRKQRRRGRQMGWRSGYTKAVVTLKQGDKIEVLPH